MHTHTQYPAHAYAQLSCWGRVERRQVRAVGVHELTLGLLHVSTLQNVHVLGWNLPLMVFFGREIYYM